MQMTETHIFEKWKKLCTIQYGRNIACVLSQVYDVIPDARKEVKNQFVKDIDKLMEWWDTKLGPDRQYTAPELLAERFQTIWGLCGYILKKLLIQYEDEHWTTLVQSIWEDKPVDEIIKDEPVELIISWINDQICKFTGIRF